MITVCGRKCSISEHFRPQAVIKPAYGAIANGFNPESRRPTNSAAHPTSQAIFESRASKIRRPSTQLSIPASHATTRQRAPKDPGRETTMVELRPEVALLVAASRKEMTPERAETCRALVESHVDDMDWSYLLDQAQRHRVLPTLGRNLNTARLLASTAVTVRPREVYRAAYLYHRNRNRALYA